MRAIFLGLGTTVKKLGFQDLFRGGMMFERMYGRANAGQLRGFRYALALTGVLLTGTIVADAVRESQPDAPVEQNSDAGPIARLGGAWLCWYTLLDVAGYESRRRAQELRDSINQYRTEHGQPTLEDSLRKVRSRKPNAFPTLGPS